MSIPRNLSFLANGASATGVLGVATGGTGAATWTTGRVLLGNGAGSFQEVAPGTAANVLTSDGTAWVSSPPTVPAGASIYTANNFGGF